MEKAEKKGFGTPDWMSLLRGDYKAGPGVYHCGPLQLSHDEQESFVAHSFILE